jgi:hypothetical protein
VHLQAAFFRIGLTTRRPAELLHACAQSCCGGRRRGTMEGSAGVNGFNVVGAFFVWQDARRVLTQALCFSLTASGQYGRRSNGTSELNEGEGEDLRR